MSSSLLTSRIVNYLLEFKWRVILAFGCLIVAKLANFGVPLTLKAIVDALGLYNEFGFSLVLPVTLIIAYASLSLSATLFNEIKEILQSKIALTIFKGMSVAILGLLIAMPIAFHASRKTGAIIKNVDRGIRAVQTMIALMMHSIAPVLLELLIIFGYLAFAYDFMFSVICLVMLITYFSFTAMVTNKWSKRRISANSYESQAAQQVNDVLLNYEVVKVFGASSKEVDRYETKLDGYYKESYLAQKTHTLLNVGQQLIISVAMASVLILTVFKVVSNEMTVGDVVLVNSLIIQLCMPLNLLGITYKELKQAFVDYRELSELFDLGGSLSEHDKFSDKYTLSAHPEIIFDNVSLVIEDTLVLDRVSFSIKSGGVTAIVGHSGSGKTSVVKLLLRLYDCSTGQISWDGKNIVSIRPDELRSEIGYVPQDLTLFNESIFYNIAYGSSGVGVSEVIDIAKKVGLHEFISTLPNGYETPVGERGLMLSGGQKQRVALARALIRRPKILIFDGATSALDVRSDYALQSEIKDLIAGVTVLVITHKLSSVVCADSVVMLDNARVLCQGSHAELLVNNECYKEMWAH